MRISLPMARRMALNAQGLGAPWRLPSGLDGACEVVNRLGYVQIDTISVVERAHHHTVWARFPASQPAMLNRLVKERRLFEYWFHAMSYLPMRDFAYYHVRMGQVGVRSWDRQWCKENRELIGQVLERVRAEGPLGSAELGKEEGRPAGSWWDWRPTKRALSVLADMGEVMVDERRAFSRRYDLTERVIPSEVLNAPLPTRDEVRRFLARRVLRAHSIISQDTFAPQLMRREAMQSALASLVEAGEAVPVEIEGADGRDYYAAPEALEEAETLASPDAARICRGVRILSPFDNALISRSRLLRLFGYDYSLECYLPAAKRTYGYFCLPVLWGDRFVGRMDAKAERKSRTFFVRHLHIEDGDMQASSDGLWEPLAMAIRGFAAFNGCPDIAVERVSPEPLAEPLTRALATI